MTIRVQFFSRLRAIGGDAILDRSCEQEATVGQFFKQLTAEFPALADWDEKLLFAIGVEFASLDQVLCDGDLLSVMPPVQGG